MAFKSYEEAVGPIELGYRGKTYLFPILTMEQGIDAHAKMEAGTFAGTELIGLFLGPAYEQMVADKVPPAVIDRALWTCIADWKHGREAAEGIWNNGIPKAVVAALTTAALEKTTPTGEANTTPEPASGSGTKPRKRTAPKP